MRKAAAGFVGGRWIDRRVTDFDERDLAVHIDHVSDAVGHSIGTQNAIRLFGGTVLEIAEQGEGKL